MKQIVLQISAGVLAAVVSGSIWAHQRRRRRDRLASQLLGEIQRIVDPQAAGIAAESAFDTGYLDGLLQSVGAKIIVIKDSAAEALAARIDDAWGFWNDDEDQIYGVFRQLRDKVQVSQVSDAYLSLTGDHLIDELRSRLDSSELTTVLDIVRPLAPYRTYQS